MSDFLIGIAPEHRVPLVLALVTPLLAVQGWRIAKAHAAAGSATAKRLVDGWDIAPALNRWVAWLLLLAGVVHLGLPLGCAEIGAVLMKTLIYRRLEMVAQGIGDALLIGSAQSAGTLRIKAFLTRNDHPFKYLDLDRDADVRDLLDRFRVEPSELPVLLGARTEDVTGGLVGGGGTSRFAVASGGTTPAVRLDDLVAERDRFSAPALLKSDTDGFEDQVLRGATSVLSHGPVLFLEYDPRLLRAAGSDGLEIAEKREQVPGAGPWTGDDRDHIHLLRWWPSEPS